MARVEGVTCGSGIMAANGVGVRCEDGASRGGDLRRWDDGSGGMEVTAEVARVEVVTCGGGSGGSAAVEVRCGDDAVQPPRPICWWSFVELI